MQKKQVTLGTRVPAKLHQRLNALATKLERSQQSIVEDALTNYLDDQESAERVSNYMKRTAKQTAEFNDTVIAQPLGTLAEKFDVEQLKGKMHEPLVTDATGREGC